MFGYVLLGGSKLKAFFWETESPEWYECVVLYSEEAIKHQVVSLHFRVLAERTFLDAEVESKLTRQDSAIVSECQLKLSQTLRIPRRVQFTQVEFIDPSMSELMMEWEVEQMLAEDDETDEYLMSDDEAEAFFNEGCFYQAEIFGDRFVGEVEEETRSCLSKRNSSIRTHMLEAIMNNSTSPLLEDTSLEFERHVLSANSCFPRTNPLKALGRHESDLHFWEMDIEDSEDEGEFMDLEFENEPEEVNPKHKRVASAPAMLSSCGFSNELERKPAFISTKGKEKEIWQTYRAEITNTWRAELQDLRKQFSTFE